jgi:hypothetical protein
MHRFLLECMYMDDNKKVVADMIRMGYRGKGQPRAFATADELMQSFADYILKCMEHNQIPNVAGFCVFADITRETFYKQQDYYPDAYQKIRQALEDRTVNNDKSVAMSIFLLKNHFNYSDRPDSDSDDETLKMSLSDDEIDKRISKSYLQLQDLESQKKENG